MGEENGQERGRRARLGRRLAVALFALVLIGAPTAWGVGAGGWNGQTPPNNPGYDGGEQNPLTGNCIHGEEWFLYSFIPKCTPGASDPEGASGMSIDQAWKQFSIGRPDVIFAYVEGGPNWHDPQFDRQLADQSYLNQGELPYPELASGQSCGKYDCNGDGVFNVQDYAQDPRVAKPYINNDILTPEDLIRAFDDCQIDEQTHLIVKCVAGQHFDNDGNGYPNDIAGWNFLYNNDDPATGDAAYPHSDEQMERALAEANNGVGDVGVCPGCELLPIKAGHEALDTTDRIAQSIYFAVDSGASVICLLTAELGYSSFTEAALQYAWSKGVVVIGASNDFDSADHQEGMFWPHEWPGNGLQPNDPSPPDVNLSQTVTSYRERSNETSFGPHALFSVPNEGGSTSESQPTQSGVALLVASEGRNAADRGLISGPLNAGEIEQVVRETASNIDDPSLGWPGEPGATFNIQYGYGRPNVLKADQAVAANRIPPVPSIDGPDWYALFDPTQVHSVPISVDVDARRAKSFDWVVQYGLGPQPTEAQFHTIASGHVDGAHVSGTLATLNLNDIPQSFWDAPFHFTSDLSSIEQYDVTIRVQATDDRGLMGEDRRVVAVFHDPQLRVGFPRYVGRGDSQPVLADLQGTGKLDIIFGDADGRVHALDPDTGKELPGWPVHTVAESFPDLGASAAGKAGAVPKAVYEPVESSPAVGDLLGDGGLDVVVSSTSGHLYAFDRNGRELAGFPKGIGLEAASYPVPPPDLAYTRPPMPGSFATPVLAPGMPGSTSKLTILQAGLDGNMYAFDGHGRTLPGWPVDTDLPAADKQVPSGDDLVDDHKLVATPTLADLLGNGQHEIVLRSQETIVNPAISSELGVGSQMYELALWPDGNDHAGGPFVPGWPAKVQGVFDYYGSAQDAITEGVESASAGPLKGDGRDELVQSAGFLGPEYELSGNGQVSGLNVPLGSAAALQNLLIDPPPVAGRESIPPSSTAAAPVSFTESGTLAQFGGGLTYLAGGVDLASMQSLLHNGIAERITNFMRANNVQTGAPVSGFPAPMMGLAFLTAPAVADVDGDGQPDVISNEDSNNVAAFQQNGQPVPGWPKFTGGWTVWTPAVGDLDGSGHNDVVDVTREGWLFVWNTPGKASQNQAYSWHQDNWHTGLYGVDTRPPLAPKGFAVVSGGAARTAVAAVGGSRAVVARRHQRTHIARPAPAGSHEVCWTAPGDNWSVGTAASYDMREFNVAPTPENYSTGVRVRGVPAPAASGTRQCAAAPGGHRYVALRAVNHSGLIGMPAVIDLAPACVSLRRVREPVPHGPRGSRVVSIAVYVDGHREQSVPANRRTVVVSLVGRPASRVTVQLRVRVRSRTGGRRGSRVRTVTATHRYLTCAAKRRAPARAKKKPKPKRRAPAKRK